MLRADIESSDGESLNDYQIQNMRHKLEVENQLFRNIELKAMMMRDVGARLAP